MNDWLLVIFLSMLPVGELRGAIPAGLALGLNPIPLYLVAVFFNTIIIFAVWIILDMLHEVFMKSRLYSKLFNRYIERSRRKIEKYIGTEKEAWGIFLFTAIPLPMTGAYTASIAAWFFNLNRRKASKAIFFGVCTAGLVVMGVSLGLLKLVS